MMHDFLHLMAIMIILARIWSIIFAFDGYILIILATTYNKSIGFGCMYNMEICFGFPCKSHSLSSLPMV